MFDIKGLFSKKQKPKQAQEEQKIINRKDMDQQMIDDMQRKKASDQYCEKIWSMYYSEYPEKPFISMDRELNTNWPEQAELFGTMSLVEPDKMQRYSDNLLPGHVYMLYWLSKHVKNNSLTSRIPSYFEYKYGIEFESEKLFLNENGYLNGNELTEKGTNALALHYDVVEAHSPEATSRKKAKKKYEATDLISIDQVAEGQGFYRKSETIIYGRNLSIVDDRDKEKISSDIETINVLLGEMCRNLKIKHSLMIPAKGLVYNENFNDVLHSYLEWYPLTPTGRKPKCPVAFYFRTSSDSCLGHIRYLNDFRILDAEINFWKGSKGYHVKLKDMNGRLAVKEIAHIVSGEICVIYSK